MKLHAVLAHIACCRSGKESPKQHKYAPQEAIGATRAQRSASHLVATQRNVLEATLSAACPPSDLRREDCLRRLPAAAARHGLDGQSALPLRRGYAADKIISPKINRMRVINDQPACPTKKRKYRTPPERGNREQLKIPVRYIPVRNISLSLSLYYY